MCKNEIVDTTFFNLGDWLVFNALFQKELVYR